MNKTIDTANKTITIDTNGTSLEEYRTTCWNKMMQNKDLKYGLEYKHMQMQSWLRDWCEVDGYLMLVAEKEELEGRKDTSDFEKEQTALLLKSVNEQLSQYEIDDGEGNGYNTED